MQEFLWRGLCGHFPKESNQEVESNCPRALLLQSSEREWELEGQVRRWKRSSLYWSVWSHQSPLFQFPNEKSKISSYLCSGMPAAIFSLSIQCCVHRVCRFLFFLSAVLTVKWILKGPTLLVVPQRAHVMPPSLNYIKCAYKTMLK